MDTRKCCWDLLKINPISLVFRIMQQYILMFKPKLVFNHSLLAAQPLFWPLRSSPLRQWDVFPATWARRGCCFACEHVEREGIFNVWIDVKAIVKASVNILKSKGINCILSPHLHPCLFLPTLSPSLQFLSYVHFNAPFVPRQQKQRCPVLEEQLVDLVVYAMERSETEEHFDADIGGTSQLLWQHLSSQLIFFVLFQFASFPHMVLSLHQKVFSTAPHLTKDGHNRAWKVKSFKLLLSCSARGQRPHQRKRPPDVGLAAVHIGEHPEERLGGFPAGHEAFRPAVSRKRGTLSRKQWSCKW